MHIIPIDVQTIALADEAEAEVAVYGDIYVTGGSSGQLNIGTSFIKLTQFAANGQSDGVTPDHTNDRLTIVTTGVYEVHFFLKTVATTSGTVTMSVHVDQAEPTEKIVQITDSGLPRSSFTASGLLSLTANQEIEIFVKGGAASDDITVGEGHLWCAKL